MVAIPLLVRRQAGTTGTCCPKFVPSRNRTRGTAGGAGEGKGGCQRRRPRRAGTGTGHLWLTPPARVPTIRDSGRKHESGAWFRFGASLAGCRFIAPASTGSGPESCPMPAARHSAPLAVALARCRAVPPSGTPANLKGQDRWHASAMAIPSRRARAARDPQRPSRRDTGPGAMLLPLTTGPVALVE
jgi:hypothetical protein